MKIGFIGLGRMGANMVLRLMETGHEPAIYNRSPEPAIALAKRGARRAKDLGQLCSMLGKRKVIWLMVSAGKPVDAVIGSLLPFLGKGEVVIEGGNSHYLDSVRRHKSLARRGIEFLDVGTSGGLGGARHGACLTIGGKRKTYRRLVPLFRSLATDGGFLYCGPAGAGNYVKTIHNGIEYSMLQAYGEGFAALERAPYRLNLGKIARAWSHGSVIRSWLLEIAASAFEKDARLSKIEGVVGGGQTGGWAIAQARRAGVRVPSMELALRERRRSEKRPGFSGKVIAAIRNGFGGHAVVKKRR